MTRAFIDAKKYTLQSPALDNPAWVDVDPVRMKQVLSNLLHNAARYTPQGGAIEVGIEVEGALVHISVKDNGIGIEAAMLPRIFDLFTQGQGGLAREDSGLGIGLTIVQRMATDHGGTVAARSAGLDCGSEFVLTLPTVALSAAATPLPPHARPVPTPDVGQPQRLQLVDDNAEALQAMADLFRLHGHACVVAAAGPQGLAAAIEHLPDIAIIDIGLLGLDGVGLAAELRRLYGADMTLIAMRG